MSITIRVDQGEGGVPMVTADVTLDAVWQVSYRCTPQGQRVAVVEARIWPRPGATLPAGGLSAGVLHQIRVGRVVDHLSRMFALLWARPGAEAPASVKALAEAFPFMRAETPPRRARKRSEGAAGRPGRRPLSELELVAAATAYLDAIKRGSARPVQEAAKRIRETPERLRDRLHRARTRGLLTTVKAGAAGGTLTPRAKELLRRQPPSKKRRPSRERRKGR